MFEVWPRFKVWSWESDVWSLSEVCLKSVRSLKTVRLSEVVCIIAITIDLNAGLLILITYIIMYFFSLFGYICMFVFVVWQINCLSFWVWSLTSVRNLTLKAKIVWSMSEVSSLMYEVWRNPKFDVRRLSENCLNYVQSLKYYLCLFKT